MVPEACDKKLKCFGVKGWKDAHARPAYQTMKIRIEGPKQPPNLFKTSRIQFVSRCDFF